MMEKTIEERANAFIGFPKEIGEDFTTSQMRASYIKGATEQKAIDDAEKQTIIDRACGWAAKNVIYFDALEDDLRQFLES